MIDLYSCALAHLKNGQLDKEYSSASGIVQDIRSQHEPFVQAYHRVR